MDPVKLTIDGREVVTTKGKKVIQAAADAGIVIPYYCYHPKLSIAGNCRMCLVEIEKMPRLQIACNTDVSEGMVVLTQSPKVVEARKSVMEFLLVNHPLDCPICDQSGECWLQDYYMQHDLQGSRFEERKEHDRKREIFGPYVVFDGERCIKCTRCVRFLQEVTRTGELEVLNRGDHSTITRFPGRTLDNPLSVNVVDICPVGALTDRDFRFKVRVWYLKKTPSVCPGCSTGCNISVETYQNRIARFKPRVNEEVNSHWLCDEGRYCFHALTEVERLTSPLIRQEGGLVPTDWETALWAALTGLGKADPLAGVLSGRNTNEEAFLFGKVIAKLSAQPALEVFYQERELTETEKVLKSPDRSPNFQGARDMGVSTNGGFDLLLRELIEGKFRGAYIVGEDLVSLPGNGEKIRQALEKLSFLVVQDTELTSTAKLAHVVLPATNFAEKEGTYTNRKGRVQKLNAALVPPVGALHDWQIFARLLPDVGEKISSHTPAEIFQEISRQIPRYGGLSYATIGELGIQLSDETKQL
ncbi:MAG: 2Fe-2S iron-sulfur cluster binding domain-containing protein [Deltaproteobacteria bacterium]|nr:MAG: 2Fe-2S iron-sulfur cluster binding domain-containing protein [Deltaproteobacteria bacterium]